MALAAAALLPILFSACASSSGPSGDQRAPLQDQVTQWINDERAKVHARPLSNDAALDKAAQGAADEIGKGATLGQAGSTTRMGDRIRASGYEQASGVELLVTGEGAPAKVLQEWHRRSPKDFTDAMDATYRDVGVGVTHRGGMLVCVLIVALSEKESFAQRTATLNDLPKVRAELLEKVNVVRTGKQLVPLKANAALEDIAQAQAEQILLGSASESSKISSQVAGAVRASSYRDSDIGYAYSEGEQTVAELLNGRLGGPTDPLVSRVMRDLGVGMAKGRTDRGYRVVWVEIVGREIKAEAAELSASLGDLAHVRKAMVARVNAERAALGLPGVVENSALDRAAQSHADDMIRKSYFGHESPDGGTLLNRAARAGYAATALGENLAQGQSSVDDAMIWWMASEGHRQQIVNGAFTEIGVGLAYAQTEGKFHVVWVQAFGSPKRSHHGKS